VPGSEEEKALLLGASQLSELVHPKRPGEREFKISTQLFNPYSVLSETCDMCQQQQQTMC